MLMRVEISSVAERPAPHVKQMGCKIHFQTLNIIPSQNFLAIAIETAGNSPL